MTPYEFGYSYGTHIEKQAAGGAGGSRFMKFLNLLGEGASNIDTGASHLVRGTGKVISGLGTGISGLAEGGKGIGRSMMQGGQRFEAALNRTRPGTVPVHDFGPVNVNVPDYSGGVFKDLGRAAGLTTRAGGRMARGAGHVVNYAGKGLNAVGQGLEGVANTGYGVPTAAALGLGYGAYSVAPSLPIPRLPVPNVRFNWPVDVDVNYRKPVEFGWSQGGSRRPYTAPSTTRYRSRNANDFNWR